MADNVIKPVLDIDVGGSITKLKEFKQYIEACKGAMLGLDESSEEYKKLAKESADAQEKLNQVLKDSRSETQATSDSYNGLVKSMALLKAQWKQTADEGERAKLGEKINDINNQLKNMDSSIGNYQRNVGNYGSAFSSAFNTMKGSVLAGVSPMKAMRLAAKNLWSALGPIGVVVGAITLVVKGLSEAFKRNESATNSLKKVMNLFQPVIIGIQRAFDGVVNVIARIMDGITRLGNKFANTKLGQKLGLAEIVNTGNEIIDLQEEVNEKTRDYQILNQKTQKEINDLQSIINNRTKSQTEREAALNKQLELKKEIENRNLELAENQLEIVKKENSLTSTGEEGLNKQAEAEAKIEEIKARISQLDAENVMTGQRISKQAATQAAREIKDAKTLAKEKYDSDKQLLTDQKELIDLKLKYVKKGSDEEVQLQRESNEKQMQLDVLEAKYKIKEEKQLRATLINILKRYYQNDLVLAQTHANNVIKVQETSLENQREQYEKGTQEWLDADVVLKEAIANNLFQQIGESDAEFQKRVIAAEKTLEEAQQAAENNKITTQTKQLTNTRDENTQGTLDWLQADIGLKRFELDNIKQQIGESDEDFYSRKLQAQKSFNDASRALVEGYVKNVTQYTDALSSVLDSVAGMWENEINAQLEAGKISQKEAERQFESVKALQYATTWINTLASVAQIMADSSIPSYYVKAALAAAQLANGIASTVQIKNTQLGTSTSTSSASASVSPQLPGYTPSYVANITDAEETQNLSNAVSEQNIWVSVRDIDSAQAKVKVRDTESTF